MARRMTSRRTADSQKDNSPVLHTTNGKMKAGSGSKRQSARVEHEEDHEEEAGQHEHNSEDKGEDVSYEEESEDQGEGSSQGRKRVRLNAAGESRPASEDKDKKKARMGTLPRDTDNFIPGSIVRVKLENFVTYDEVEFKPGPWLNMILGPNGTGKSSIACAICLGLNFPPSVLGRAAEISSFVKTGKSSGYIEIELKGKKGKRNLVIKRTLSSTSKSSTFTINGESATGKEINARMAELNVQVSNLCSFLPQDKVAEFARMSPQQLLRETQRAAGNENLTAWHDTLISAGKELKLLQESVKTDRDQLKTLEERNQSLERDVKKYEERRKLEREVELLELVLPFSEYREARDIYTVKKELQRDLHDKVKKLKAKNTPIQERMQKLEREYTDLNDQREEMKRSTKKKFQTMQQKWTDNEKLENDAEDLKNELDRLKSNEKNRQKDMQKLEKSIANMQNQIDNPPEMEDISVIQEELRQLKHEHNEIKTRFDELHYKQNNYVEERSRHNAQVNRYAQELKQLDDASHRKLEDMARFDRDGADTVKWLRANRHRFKMEVFEPPVLSLTVPNKNYVNAVEACFSLNQTRTFVAQCEEDYQTLNRLVADTSEALGRKARINTWYRAKSDNLPGPPLSEKEMQELGFDGYALQYVICPEGMMWYLQNAVQLHRTAIALDARKVNPARAMEMISRLDAHGRGGASYVIGNIMNTVTRSKYGKRLPQNVTREIRPARSLVHSAVDPAVKQALDKSLAEAKHNLELCEQTNAALAKEETDIQDAQREYMRKHDAVMVRKTKLAEMQSRLQRLSLKMESETSKLEALRNMLPPEAERELLKKRLLVCASKRATIVKEYCKLIHSAIKEQEEATRVGLQYLQIGANKLALQNLFEDRNQQYKQALEAFNQAHREYDIAKEDSRAKLEISREKLASVDDEIRTQFRGLEESGEVNERASADVLDELENLRARLEQNVHMNAGILETYRKRSDEIKNLKEIIENRETKIQKSERNIKSARDNWQPALEKLVASIGEKFSAAFDRIGCAGEIKISEHEDYDQWAIDIMVKFRDIEKLQLLTGERQSGGERSLTTILYLMSLTEEARAPFSLVDEINQGMDQRAERAVHNSLVEVTCKQDSGQYFLITPKLLTDLNYHERMRVLCVNNGEWLPEERGLGNMMAMIDGYVGARQRANASN